MKYLLTLSLTILLATAMSAQDLPYHQIPDAPETYTAGTVAARMIDGLGYRYYWATEGLTDKDLDYNPGNEGRKCSDVLYHLQGLSEVIKNATLKKSNIRPAIKDSMTWDQTRITTLNNLKTASDILRKLTDAEVTALKIEFTRGEKTSSFDYWHMMNGPIADAMTHVGQIVSYRRSAGNPINSKVNVFMGKNRE